MPNHEKEGRIPAISRKTEKTGKIENLAEQGIRKKNRRSEKSVKKKKTEPMRRAPGKKKKCCQL